MQIMCLLILAYIGVIYIREGNILIKELERYHNEKVMGFATLVDNRDDNTGGHIRRSSAYALLIGENLRKNKAYKNEITKDFLNNLTKSAPMHDIGKIGIPDAIASDYALQELLAHYGIVSSLCHDGEIDKLSSVKMLRLLGAELSPYREISGKMQESDMILICTIICSGMSIRSCSRSWKATIWNTTISMATAWRSTMSAPLAWWDFPISILNARMRWWRF